MKTIVISALLLTIITLSPVSIAHSGGTDSQGCHYDHIRGGYHCH